MLIRITNYCTMNCMFKKTVQFTKEYDPMGMIIITGGYIMPSRTIAMV